MKKYFLKTLLLTATLIFTSLGVSFAEPKKGGTLIAAVGNNPRHLNPAVQSGIVTGFPGAQLFATPIRYDNNWEPQPYLAESWEISDGGKTVKLNLVKDAVFHDGVPIKSSDVKFSLETIKKHHPFKTMFAPVVSVETPDEHTAVLKLSSPHPALMLAMSSQLMAIIPEHVYGDGQDPKTHPQNSENVVGSGPFKLVEFKSGEHIILERFDDFFIDGRPYLDKMVLKIIRDPATRTIGLENGEIDFYAFENVPTNINRLKKNANLNVTPDGYAAIGPIDWLAFNTKTGKTADVKVRQAIAYAIDRNFILKAIMLGVADEARTGIHPGSPYYEPNVEAYDFDIDKANKILDDAGYKKGSDGMRFGLNVDFGWPGLRPNAEYTKAALKKIGIDVTVRQSADFPTWAQTVSNHNFDLTWDTVFNWGDPVIGVHRTYQTSNIKKGVIWSNTQQYSNPKVDAIMEKAGVENDMAKRKALYSELQKMLANDLPVYWTNTLPYHTIYSNKVGNPPMGIWATSSPMDMTYIKE